MFSNIKTDDEKKAAIKLLKSAHNKIRDGLNSLVCNAVEDSEESYMDIRVSQFIRNEISHRLEGYGYVTSWLRNNHSPAQALHDADHSQFYVLAREYRLRWIDSMIKEIKEQNV